MYKYRRKMQVFLIRFKTIISGPSNLELHAFENYSVINRKSKWIKIVLVLVFGYE